MADDPGEAPNHDFLEQLLEMQTYAAAADPNLAGTVDVNLAPMMLQLNSASGGYHAPPPVFPLGLSLDQGKPAFLKPDEGSGFGSGSANKRFREDMVDAPKNVSAERKLGLYCIDVKLDFLLGWQFCNLGLIYSLKLESHVVGF